MAVALSYADTGGVADCNTSEEAEMENKTVRHSLLDASDEVAGATAGLAASWSRSREAGLQPHVTMSDAMLDATALRLLREANEQLITVALPELENLYCQIAGTNSAVLLADANGVILERQGDPAFRQRSQSVALRPGACWGEADRGTNAIGLALTEGRCASVHGAEHFLACNTFLTCAATPIRNAAGTIVGLLDVSGDQPARQLHALGLVRMGARMIENRMLMAEFPDAFYLRFHARPELVGTLGEGIAVISASGHLLAMNAVAHAHFKTARAGTPITDYFELSGDLLASLFGHLVPIKTTYGLLVHALVAGKDKPLTPFIVPEIKPPLKQIDESFAELQVGDLRIAEAGRRALRVVEQNIPVLIEGETGTGKEWLVRAVHKRSSRSDKPLITVNCAAIPETLAEAELFGYTPGAFTGANRDGASGRLVEADGGILFLDEVGDMPLELQTRLLRVLQEREVVPVGGTTPRPVNFLLLSATHQHLASLVEEGRFRSDLFYRLCGLNISLPPLRQRGDLSALIQRMVAEIDPGVLVSKAAMGQLLAHHWPGNLRELDNVLRTAMALRSSANQLDVADLPMPANRQPTLKSRESELMADAIARHGGNFSAAARELGVSRSTLYRRLQSADLKMREKPVS